VVSVDFALICATHCKLREAVAQGRFRSDLFYRINGLMVQLPALRERTDFVTLTGHLLADLNPQGQVHIAPELLERFSRHTWPGNLRQYANALRTASAMLDAHETCIDWRHLSDDLIEDLSDQVVVKSHVGLPRAPEPSTKLEDSQNLAQLSQAVIRQALDQCAGNMSEAARRLGISRQTLYRKLNA
jgi:transcriptional regulator of acetoin/glycerol metabolism